MRSSKKKALKFFPLFALLISILVIVLACLLIKNKIPINMAGSANTAMLEPEDLLRKCGDITRDDFGVVYTPAHVISGPEWSSDCQYAVIGMWYKQRPYEASTQLEDVQANKIDGIYIYSSSNKQTTKAYSPKSANETPAFTKWVNPHIVLFSNGSANFNYDTQTQEINSVN